MRKYRNEVVELRFPSIVPTEPRRPPEAAGRPCAGYSFRRERPAPSPRPPGALAAWSSRSHGAGAAVSTMELAAWCRWGLLLALLPPGAAGTQGGSGVGRAGSGDGPVQPGTPV